MRRIHDERFNSGFFTFIKSGGKISDDDLLNRLKIVNYQRLQEENKKNILQNDCCKLYITEVDNWIHIMDDWGYSFMRHLWIKREEKIIMNLAKDFEIFQCSIGNSDLGFDFSHFQGGKLRQKYVVRNKKLSFTETCVVENIGSPFSNESIALKKSGELNKILAVAELVGIRINHESEKIRSYRMLDMKI